jgi:hypothetical protein
VVSVPQISDLEGNQQQQQEKLVIHPRDQRMVASRIYHGPSQPEVDLNMFLGCLVRDWNLGFVGLAAKAITNFWNVWKALLPSRKTRLRCYNCSAEQELLDNRRGLEARDKTARGPAPKGTMSWRREDLEWRKVLFSCPKGCHVEKGRQVLCDPSMELGQMGGYCKARFPFKIEESFF